jgi:ketosteroid isomerase-like protein
MQRSHRKLVEDFFTALSAGALSDDLFTDDMTVWTTTSGTSPRQRYQVGVAVLKSLFQDGPHYSMDSLTVEDDRAAAEVQAHGVLVNGAEYRNSYAFIFRVRNGRIASLAEHCNPLIVREKILPLMPKR